MTNADKIRQMTDEELSEIITCPDELQCSGFDCNQCILMWLKEERDDER